ncbi:rhomboid family intramembrane serine protease [Carnobacterium maltaromaticum]|uniref:rhomboid family intramembrane serine protease n=1 Tax=Carnobacterium maltaromaticum TaxID=2751 RepID=UPI00295EDD35|nr:rhomboid family intramembrane serine protease [Carnobacterium maltaromaticum]
MNYQTEMKLKRFSNKPFMTYTFLTIQIVLFLMMTLFFGGSENTYTLILFGAKFNPLIVMGDWWRLITPMFLHIGWLHLAVNSVCVYYIGTHLEKIMGHWRFALIYLLSGVAGNVASFAFSDSVSAGASTSIFGLFATTLMLAETFKGNAYYREIAKTFGILIVFNFITGFLSIGDGNVDNAGHAGGLVGGFLIATAISVPNAPVDLKTKRIIAGVAYTIALLFFIAIGFKRTTIGV